MYEYTMRFYISIKMYPIAFLNINIFEPPKMLSHLQLMNHDSFKTTVHHVPNLSFPPYHISLFSNPPSS